MAGKVYTVALAGGIGSGKTAVAGYLRSCGVPVYDSDSATKALYARDHRLVRRIGEAIGKDISLPDGSLDKAALAKEIFSSREALEAVEAVVHPAVLQDFDRWKEENSRKSWCGFAGQPPFVVIESAIILEKPLFRGSYDAAVVVDAPLELRVERAAERDGVPAGAILARVRSQKVSLELADQVIVNDSDLETLRHRTDIAFKLLILQSE